MDNITITIKYPISGSIPKNYISRVPPQYEEWYNDPQYQIKRTIILSSDLTTVVHNNVEVLSISSELPPTYVHGPLKTLLDEAKRKEENTVWSISSCLRG
jgi:hypothetical protein